MKVLDKYRERNNYKGQATLEFAMIIPFVIIIILAASQVGFTVYTKMVMQQTVREAARILSVTNNSNLASGVIHGAIGDDITISIDPAESHQRKIGDMISITISKSPCGFIKILDNLIESDLTIRAKSSMRMECE